MSAKGAGAGQGHEPRSEVRLRSRQDAGPVWKAGAGAGLGASPGESPQPRAGSEPAPPPPTLGTRRLCWSGSGHLVLLPGAPDLLVAGVRRGRGQRRPLPRCPARAQSLPAVTFRSWGATRRPGSRPALT